MDPKFHPPEDILLDYCTGSLGPAAMMLVRTHIEICSQCQKEVEFLQRVSGALFADISPAPQSDLTNVAAHEVITNEPDYARFVEERIARQSRVLAFPSAGGPRSLLFDVKREKLKWQVYDDGLHASRLPDLPGNPEQYLYHMAAGYQAKPAAHDGKELVVVLEGAFQDNGKLFEPGDLQVIEPFEEHSPFVHCNMDCLCFVAVERTSLKQTA